MLTCLLAHYDPCEILPQLGKKGKFKCPICVVFVTKKLRDDRVAALAKMSMATEPSSSMTTERVMG